jgi:hypothetical protein
MESTSTADRGEAWRRHAEPLADWTFARLIVRRDVYGGTKPDGSRFTVHEPVTRDVLIRHYHGEITIGVHSIGPENESLALTADIDAHDTASYVGVNWQCVDVVIKTLQEFQLSPLVCDSDGKGGYHIRQFFKKPVPSAAAKWLGDLVTERLQEEGLPRIEFFPKQNAVTLQTPFGNWIRLPGKHHKRDHWTRVRDPRSLEWLDGEFAVKTLIRQAGDVPTLLLQAFDEHEKSRAGGKTRPPDRNSGIRQADRADEPRVRAALEHIQNLDVTYDEWLGIGMSLNNWDPSRGLPIWTDWSAQSSKHDEATCRAKWDSFAPGGGLTIASLFRAAIENGWDPHRSERGGLSSAVSGKPSVSSAAQKPRRKANLICFADIAEESVEWLWYPRLPLGMNILFAGAPKVGKTFVTLGIAAAVSRGAALPLDEPRRGGSVVILSAEDDPAKTLKPRLRACGAKMAKIHFLKSVLLDDGSESLPSLRADLEAIEAAASELGDCRLIIIDPVSAYLNGIDDHKNAEIRGLLFPLEHTGRRLNASVVLVTHLNKASTQNAQQRVCGSVAYVAACRMNFLFAKDKEDPASRRRLMLDNGCNLTEEVPTLGYRIADSGEGPQIEWEQEPLAITADEAMTEQPAQSTDDDAEKKECDDWLKDALRSGPVAQKELVRQGREVGFSEDKLKRAKKRIGAKSDRDGFGQGSKYDWFMPRKELSTMERTNPS